MLGVSIGTVDRALHARPGINPMTRARVLKMAETMGYRPNLAARFLKARKQIRLSAQLPEQIAGFFDQLRDGIREAAAAFAPAIHVQFRSYSRLGEGDTELFEQAINESTQGIIITPGEPGIVKPLIRRAARKNIPVVCVATDAPGTERLASVTACPHTAGAVSAELLCRFISGPGKLLAITGSLHTADHAEKIEGFRRTLQAFGTPLELCPIIEAHDDEGRAYEETRKRLAECPEIRGVYVSTANCLPVLKAIEESTRAGQIAVITTDLFPALVPLIRSGRVLATVHQRPFTQGRLAFEALYQFLVEGKCPLPRIRVAPHIVMNSNLDLFLERITAEEEG